MLSTYMGSDIPGKPVEQVNYTGGIPMYRDEIRAVMPDWKGFRVVHADKDARVDSMVQSAKPAAVASQTESALREG